MIAYNGILIKPLHYMPNIIPGHLLHQQPMTVKLSILIVTWNSWADLKRCLESIQRLNLSGMEILIIDNGSADDTVDKLNLQFGDTVRLHVNPINLGLPAAVNIGLKLVRGEYVMLLDVDTEVEPNAAARLLAFMEAHPDVALIAPRIRTSEGQDERTARNLPSVTSGLFGRQSLFARKFPNNPFTRRYLASTHHNNSTPYQVEQVSAACMFFRQSLFDTVGPWDEKYRCYWVDTDWCARLKKLSAKVYCVPQARIIHYENNRAGKKKSTWRIWHFHIGAYRLYRKHYTLGFLDPRALLAGAVLAARACVMLVLNEMKSDASRPPPTNH
jgi:N-acetylglucosaminyl-diphospho-decaprenol L-rhamnosyltransferase